MFVFVIELRPPDRRLNGFIIVPLTIIKKKNNR